MHDNRLMKLHADSDKAAEEMWERTRKSHYGEEEDRQDVNPDDLLDEEQAQYRDLSTLKREEWDKLQVGWSNSPELVARLGSRAFQYVSAADQERRITAARPEAPVQVSVDLAGRAKIATGQVAKRDKIAQQDAFRRQMQQGGLTVQPSLPRQVNPAQKLHEPATSQVAPDAQGEEELPKETVDTHQPAGPPDELQREGDSNAARQTEGPASPTDVGNGSLTAPLEISDSNPGYANSVPFEDSAATQDSPRQMSAGDAQDKENTSASQLNQPPRDPTRSTPKKLDKPKIDMESAPDEEEGMDLPEEMDTGLDNPVEPDGNQGTQADEGDAEGTEAPTRRVRRRRRSRVEKPESWREPRRTEQKSKYGLRKERTISSRARKA